MWALLCFSITLPEMFQFLHVCVLFFLHLHAETCHFTMSHASCKLQTVVKGKSWYSNLQPLFRALTCAKWISLQKMPMRDQNTHSALAAGLSGACASAFRSAYCYEKHFLQSAIIFFVRKRLACVYLTYQSDENSEVEVPLVCLQVYPSAECGEGGYLCTCTHAHPVLHATWSNGDVVRQNL